MQARPFSMSVAAFIDRGLFYFHEGFSCEDKHAMCGADMQRLGALYWCVCAPKEACGLAGIAKKRSGRMYSLHKILIREGDLIMVSKKFVIENEQGLHMRPAGVLAKAVTKFESDVTIIFEDKKINAKSLLNIIGACIKCGSEIELVCEGPDEEAALAHATELIESGLGE